MKRRLALVIACGLLLAGCRAGAAGGDVEHPAGDALVLQIDVSGGLVGPDVSFGNVPTFTMLGDGSVIQSGAVPAIFPGPLVTPLIERRLSDQGLQQVLSEVTATGLFGESRTLPAVAVADGPDTIFTLDAAGRETVVTVNALGLGGVGSDDASRLALSGLQERLLSLDAWLPASGWAEVQWDAYAPSAYRLLVRDVDAGEQDPTGIGFNLAVWPAGSSPDLGAPAAAGGRCVIATGNEARAWTLALAGANQLTRWTLGGRRYQVQPRPLLPGVPHECSAA